MTGRCRRALTTAVFAAVVGSACSVSGLAFVQDRRLEFVSHDDRESVRLPVTIEWTIEDFEVVDPDTSGSAAPGEGYFGVFLDARPQPPGEPMTWHAEGDETCERDPGCPDDEWYRLRGIHTTTEPEFTIDRLSRPSDDTRRELHTITVVLLDAEGVRIGESAWQLEFEIDRTDPPS